MDGDIPRDLPGADPLLDVVEKSSSTEAKRFFGFKDVQRNIHATIDTRDVSVCLPTKPIWRLRYVNPSAYEELFWFAFA